MNSNPTAEQSSPDLGIATDHTAAQVADAAHRAVDIAAANLARAEEALHEARRAAGISVSEAADEALAATEDTLDTVREYVRENPLRAVGIAVAAGFLTSVLLRR